MPRYALFLLILVAGCAPEPKPAPPAAPPPVAVTPAPTFVPSRPAPVPSPPAPSPAAEAAGFLKILDDYEGMYQQVLTAVRGGHPNAQQALGIFVSSTRDLEIQAQAFLETRGLARHNAPAWFQHVLKANGRYLAAGEALKNYLLFKSDYWLNDAAEKHAEARSERDAAAQFSR